MQIALASLRVAIATMLVCVVAYTAVVLGFAQLVVPGSAEGSLILSADGTVVGSRLVAQKFTASRYLWPRPSAVDYNAAGAGGSNKSPTSTDLTDRAAALVAAYGATPDNPLPPELAAASGSGLDPDISLTAARYQVARIAAARGLSEADVEAIVTRLSYAPGGILAPERLVNVLAVNLALDQSQPG